MIVGRAVTLNALAIDDDPPSRLVTVTVRAPTVAEVDTERLTVRWVEFVRVTELTVIPPPVKATDEVGHEPDRKLEPVMTIDWLVAPWPRELGLSDEIPGAGLTSKALALVPRPPSRLTTVTSRKFVVAPDEIDRTTVKWVGLVRVTEFTVIPLPEKRTFAGDQGPLAKFEPVMTVDRFVAPRPPVSGLSDETLGAAVMARQLEQVALDGPGLVTVTLRFERLAPPETDTLAVIVVALTRTTELTVSPLPEIASEAPEAKPAPVTVTGHATAPRPMAFGTMPVTLRLLLTTCVSVLDVLPTKLASPL